MALVVVEATHINLLIVRSLAKIACAFARPLLLVEAVYSLDSLDIAVYLLLASVVQLI